MNDKQIIQLFKALAHMQASIDGLENHILAIVDAHNETEPDPVDDWVDPYILVGTPTYRGRPAPPELN